MYESKQAYKDEVKQRVLDGRLPCYNKNNAPNQPLCLYRDTQGNACVAGMCIPDEKYSSKLESSGYCTSYAIVDAMILPPDVTVAKMRALQSEHDNLAIKIKGPYSEETKQNFLNFLEGW